jgi:hypothetical protein
MRNMTISTWLPVALIGVIVTAPAAAAEELLRL